MYSRSFQVRSQRHELLLLSAGGSSAEIEDGTTTNTARQVAEIRQPPSAAGCSIRLITTDRRTSRKGECRP